jgi:hypothetical protein
MSLPPSGQRRTCGHTARRQPRRTTQASQTPRSANQWARATCTPHHGVALVVPMVGYHAIAWSSPRATARSEKPVKQVPSETRGRAGVTRNRTSSPGSRRARRGERDELPQADPFTAELVFRHRTSPAFPPNCTREALPRHYPGCGVVMGRGTGQRRLCSSTPRGTRKTGAGYSTRHEVSDPRQKGLAQVLGPDVRGRLNPLPP